MIYDITDEVKFREITWMYDCRHHNKVQKRNFIGVISAFYLLTLIHRRVVTPSLIFATFIISQ